MTKEEKIKLVENRILFLSAWKEIIKRKEAFQPMYKIFQLLEADYDHCLIPVDDKERLYGHFKSPEKIVCSKLGKYLVKHYGNYIPADHVLSEFVAILNAIIWKEPPKINVYKGNDLMNAYLRSNDNVGVSSCMTKDGKHVYMKILAANPDKVEIQCLEDVDKIFGRVLVWTLDDGKRVVDRIYPNSGEHYEKLLHYYSNLDNHFVRTHHEAPDDSKVVTAIEGLKSPMVLMNCKGVEKYPYMDTFRYGAKMEDQILLSVEKLTDPVSNLTFDNQYGTPTEIE